MARDGGLYDILKRNFNDAHWQKIETGAVGSGVPDTEVCWPGGLTMWIEYKETETTAVGMRPEQIAWIGRRSRLGGRVWILIRQRHDGGPRKGPPIDTLWIAPGHMVEALAKGGLIPGTPGYCTYAGGPRRWPWTEIRRHLTGVNPAVAHLSLSILEANLDNHIR